jgi:formate dehydrogenase major subunit
LNGQSAPAATDTVVGHPSHDRAVHAPVVPLVPAVAGGPCRSDGTGRDACPLTTVGVDEGEPMQRRDPRHERAGRRGRHRLTVPLVRDGRELREATWDEALDRAAEGLGRAREAIGSGRSPHAFGMFSCSKATNEVNYLAQKFARVVMGSNDIDSCNRT